jgi:hypothetical protein
MVRVLDHFLNGSVEVANFMQSFKESFEVNLTAESQTRRAGFDRDSDDPAVVCQRRPQRSLVQYQRRFSGNQRAADGI